MSAINPASFASPTLGLQAPSGVGPGAVVNRGSSAAARRQGSHQESQPGQAARGVQPPFQASFNNDRALAAGSNYPLSSFPYNPYGAFGNASRAGAMQYNPGMMQGLDAFANAFPQGGDYAGRGRFPSPQSNAGSQHDQPVPALGSQADLLGSLQGLSLNSR